eukprot:9959957-Alexandrium_andersonii.AAC.1
MELRKGACFSKWPAHPAVMLSHVSASGLLIQSVGVRSARSQCKQSSNSGRKGGFDHDIRAALWLSEASRR